MTKIMDFDSALEQVGEFGRHQKRIYFIVSLISLPLACQMLIIVFIGAVPEWKCPSASGDIFHCNSSHPACCDKDGSICHGAEFSSEFTSITTEWKLACGYRYKSEFSQSIFVSGYMFGVLIFSILSDRYGRRKPWVFAYIVGGILGLMTGLARSYEEYIALRFIMGALKGGGGLITYVLSTESIGSSYRGSAGTWQQAFYSFGYVVLTFEAYFIRDWRALTIISILPTLLVLLVFKSIPESPRWLVAQGRIEEAENILRKIQRENGCGNTEVILRKTHLKPKKGDEKSSNSQRGIMDLFTHQSMCIVTVVMMLSWCVTSMVYYGLALNVKHLEGNLYINFVLGSLIELPSFVVTQALLSKFGRRLSLFFLLLGSSASCFLCMFLQLEDGSNVTVISMAALGGRFCICAAYTVLYVYSAELFPTIVRNAGMGVSSLSARIGGMIAPFIVLMGDHHASLPMFVFALCTLFAGIAGLKLHETQGKRMPETFEDLEESHSKKAKTNDDSRKIMNIAIL